MRPLLGLAALLLLMACGEISPSIGSGQGGSSAAAGASGAGGGSLSNSCSGFRDIKGTCVTAACLVEAECDASTAALACSEGVRGTVGTCFAGQCAYINAPLGCVSGADCPCGLCGRDGRCYEDRNGGCGVCTPSSTGGSSGNHSVPCKSCLESCQGIGPSCCAGEGCLCEPQCSQYL